MKPEDFGITKYKFRPDGTLDVFENVYMEGENLKELPFNFGRVNGYFKCGYNRLKTLKGAPKVVNGYFSCFDNRLESLKYSPKIVNGSFNCSYNNLTSLKGLNLDGVSGDIYVYDNPNLKLSEKEQLWMTLNPGRLVF